MYVWSRHAIIFLWIIHIYTFCLLHKTNFKKLYNSAKFVQGYQRMELKLKV